MHDGSRHATQPPWRWSLQAMHYIKYLLFLNHTDYREEESILAGSASPSISTQLTTASVVVITPLHLCVTKACFVVPIVTIFMITNNHDQGVKFYAIIYNNLLIAFRTAAIGLI